MESSSSERKNSWQARCNERGSIGTALGSVKESEAALPLELQPLPALPALAARPPRRAVVVGDDGATRARIRPAQRPESTAFAAWNDGCDVPERFRDRDPALILVSDPHPDPLSKGEDAL